MGERTWKNPMFLFFVGVCPLKNDGIWYDDGRTNMDDIDGYHQRKFSYPKLENLRRDDDGRTKWNLNDGEPSLKWWLRMVNNG